AGRADRVWQPVGRAQAILDELNYSLDMSQGQVSENLRSIYSFCKRQLLEGALQRDERPLRHVARLLSELCESWEQIPAHQLSRRPLRSARRRVRDGLTAARRMNPYEELVALAVRRRDLVIEGRYEELARLDAERDSLLASLPPRPPAGASPALEELESVLDE